MSHEIETVRDYVETDSLRQNFTVPNDDDPNVDRKDLNGASLSWELLDDGVVLVDDSHADVNVFTTDAGNGEFSVEIGRGVTSGFTGNNEQRVTIVDGSGWQRTYVGDFPVNPR